MNGTIETHKIYGGEQVIILFDNGRGISAVRHQHSYGYAGGLWEAAPIAVDSESERGWNLAYCELMPDVEGYLTMGEMFAIAQDMSCQPHPVWGENVSRNLWRKEGM